jgi:AraC family transcriptional regulator
MHGEFSGKQTHGIGQWAGNQVLAQSGGRGWRNVYAALATVNSWSGTLDPVKNYCVAFCVNRPARLRRIVVGEGETGTAVVTPRQFLVIPAHQPSEWQRQGPSEMLMLYLRHDMVESVSNEIFDREGVQIEPRLGATDPLLEQLSLAVLQTLRQPEPMATALYVDGLALTIAAQLVRAHSRHAAVPLRDERPGVRGIKGLSRLRDFIESSLDQDLTLETLAREAGISMYALPRAFQQHFGDTPHQYVLGRRLLRARALLANTDLPIAEIALETGFSSQSHLATAFKRCVGVTPNGYRHSQESGVWDH